MPGETRPSVLILTPMKDAVRHLPRYASLLEGLDWPRERLSLGILEGDSADGTFEMLTGMTGRFESRVSRFTLMQRSFGFRMPAGVPRWSPAYQQTRRQILARARNHLLFGALRDEDYVLWMDCDLETYPPDVLSQLVGSGLDIVMPHCTTTGGATFDHNAWADKGRSNFASRPDAARIRLDSVGGTMLLVRADCHRDGLIFPPFPYGNESAKARDVHPVWKRGEIETEGLGIMAADMGLQCWGLPQVTIVHADG
ncbi:MAG: hypothetical protein ABL879_11135 [Devosia sp.]